MARVVAARSLSIMFRDMIAAWRRDSILQIGMSQLQRRLIELGLGVPAESLTRYTANGWHQIRALR